MQLKERHIPTTPAALNGDGSWPLSRKTLDFLFRIYEVVQLIFPLSVKEECDTVLEVSTAANAVWAEDRGFRNTLCR